MNNQTIEELHEENLKLIREHSLKAGDTFKMINKDLMVRSTLPLNSVKNGDIFTISHINKYYGWILFKETEQLPQDVKTILKGMVKIELKGGLKKNGV